MEFGFRIAVRFDICAAEDAVGGDAKVVESAEATGGTWSGSFGSGVVVAGGFSIDKTSSPAQGVHKVKGSFKLRADDEDSPAEFEMCTEGSLSGPPNVLDAVKQSGESDANSRSYSYRTFISVKTTDERYLERFGAALWVGSGIWTRDELVIE
ncbi:hypothetical protein K4K56_004950 [Colletotrichum sp. SAR 10_98]|nr:hypothetical protein K4K56_004950 [Colletotrichum sp. SAR 10_98]